MIRINPGHVLNPDTPVVLLTPGDIPPSVIDNSLLKVESMNRSNISLTYKGDTRETCEGRLYDLDAMRYTAVTGVYTGGIADHTVYSYGWDSVVGRHTIEFRLLWKMDSRVISNVRGISRSMMTVISDRALEKDASVGDSIQLISSSSAGIIDVMVGEMCFIFDTDNSTLMYTAACTGCGFDVPNKWTLTFRILANNYSSITPSPDFQPLIMDPAGPLAGDGVTMAVGFKNYDGSPVTGRKYARAIRRIGLSAGGQIPVTTADFLGDGIDTPMTIVNYDGIPANLRLRRGREKTGQNVVLGDGWLTDGVTVGGKGITGDPFRILLYDGVPV